MRDTTRQDYTRRLTAVLRYIQDRLDTPPGTPPGLDELARLACFSPAQFHRFFRGMTGEGLAEHVRRLRLERAAMSLAYGGYPLAHIAQNAGYDSQESFTRAFKRHFGEPPGAWRGQRHLPARDSGVHYLPGGTRATLHLTPRSFGMDVTIKTPAPLRVACIRHTGAYQDCGPTWDRLCAWAGGRGLLGPETLFCGVCYDDPQITPPEKIRYDACVGIPEHTIGDDGVEIRSLFGGSWASFLHTGPYSALQQAYADFYGVWLPASGRSFREEPSVEIYLNHPDATAPENLRTEILIPLRD